MNLAFTGWIGPDWGGVDEWSGVASCASISADDCADSSIRAASAAPEAGVPGDPLFSADVFRVVGVSERDGSGSTGTGVHPVARQKMATVRNKRKLVIVTYSTIGSSTSMACQEPSPSLTKMVAISPRTDKARV